ncbi:MAG: UDP-N-acetylglucosamine 2-epimerase (non-hydrolyzing), partial [Burkholderiales bacterium]|nr:UDP-N-acetylglucosamine 2-epimerase (non-hydrolyzing) [Burkholderiales bacterium]
GARPQFIKAAAVSRVIREFYASEVEEILVHTGQHHDTNMSNVFFDELDIPRAKYNLKISGGQHGAMTGRMLEAVEKVLLKEKPDWLLVYGDTNSTLAGALAAAKLHIPVAHVEAGLRSFNMNMPEEVNRIITDRISSQLFCPTETAVKNLRTEGIDNGVHNVGDVMYDVALFYKARAKQESTIVEDLNLSFGSFALATCHRAENTDDPQKLSQILVALSDIAKSLPVIVPMHPRTLKLIEKYALSHEIKSLNLIDPLSFLDMIALEQASRLILTDSGGVQKEAFFYGVPCITMRNETEWVETVKLGCNSLTGANKNAILSAAKTSMSNDRNAPLKESPYGQGNAATAIVSRMIKGFD